MAVWDNESQGLGHETQESWNSCMKIILRNPGTGAHRNWISLLVDLEGNPYNDEKVVNCPGPHTHDPQKIRSTSYTRQFYNQSISMRSREIAPEKGPAKSSQGIRRQCKLQNRDSCRYTLNPKVLLRFLLARQCSVERAFEMLSSVLAWRQQTLSILRGFQVFSGLLESQFWSCFGS